MPHFGLEIRYNNRVPVRCFSTVRGGVSAHLFTAKKNRLRLNVTVKRGQRRTTYSLPTIVPGDVFRFRFLKRRRAGRQTIAKLRRFTRGPVTGRTRKGFRLGLDFHLKTGENIRTSHPKDGGFSFMLGNIPLEHARVFVMAWNRKENWHWQLSDLHPNEEVIFHTVETDWYDEPPTVKRAYERL
jgi:hypothetical protein